MSVFILQAGKVGEKKALLREKGKEVMEWDKNYCGALLPSSKNQLHPFFFQIYNISNRIEAFGSWETKFYTRCLILLSK